MKLHLFNGVEQSDEMLSTDEKTERKEMKEGDYLRQRMSVDDEEDEENKSSTGCLTLKPRHRSSSSSDCPASPRRPRSVSDDTGAANHSKIAEKILRILHYHSEDHSGGAGDTSRRASSRSAGALQAGCAQPRRRYLRVVKDADAPPPECIGDNPNLICRYSQDFLRDHYDRKRHATGDNPQPTLPYVPSEHTILKKSSTDPTCGPSGSTMEGMKHAMFSDVVTVVETANGTTHEEQLHDNSSVEDVSEGLESVSEEPTHTNEFFLTEDSTDGADNFESVPVFEAAAEMPAETDLCHDNLGKAVAKNSAAFMSILSSTAQPEEPTGIASEEKLRRLPTTTKRVDLAELMAQLRSNDLTSRADRDSA